ncbi:hypothetical protein ACQUY5_24520 [Bacillus cereus]|uniref:hypothetical protein n=1 Tax=Bacillus cereus TaxID=1396 RepID=UPI003D185196
MTTVLSTKRKQAIIQNVGNGKVVPFYKLFYYMDRRIENGTTIKTIKDGLVVQGKFVSLTDLIHNRELELVIELENGKEVDIKLKESETEEVVHGYGLNYDSFTFFTNGEVVPIIISNKE